MRVEVAQVIRRHDAQAAQQNLWQIDVRCDRSRVRIQQLGQPIRAVDDDPAFPGQVVEPDVVQGDFLRANAEELGEEPLETDRDIAQSDSTVT